MEAEQEGGVPQAAEQLLEAAPVTGAGAGAADAPAAKRFRGDDWSDDAEGTEDSPAAEAEAAVADGGKLDGGATAAGFGSDSDSDEDDGPGSGACF